MKAFTKSKYGGPEVLQLEDVEKPDLKDNHILVKVIANSANPADWHILRGEPVFARFSFGLFQPKEKILGADFAGIVEAIGKNVEHFSIGDRMNSTILKYFSLITISLLLISCRPKEPNKIIGKWSGEDGRGNKQIFQFKNDDTALWIFSPSAKADTFNLDYKIKYSPSPAELDLSGFNRGFLKDKTLYGIIEFVHEDTFKVDFEPGPVDTIPQSIRPRSFTEQTVTYSKLK